MIKRILYIFAILNFQNAYGATVSIKDPTSDYQMKVNTDGSINTNGGGGGGGTVTQGPAGTDPWPVISTPLTVSTSTITNISTVNGMSVTLVGANSSRSGLEIFDLSAASCYVAMNTVASNTQFSFIMVPMHYYRMDSPVYRGAVSAYCNNGNILITEY